MDIISQLPDDLLLRILSLKKTKDVMATSLLSKRWRSLWTLVPGLGYDDSNHNDDYKLFTQFVYRSFLSNKAHVLGHLHLSLGPKCPFVDIGLWINLAVIRHVRELVINIPYSTKGSFSLPSSLYTSETLESLKLIYFVFLDVPPHVRLPSLKTLSLKFVTYPDNTSLQRLLSGCPNLEGLSVVEQGMKDAAMDVNVVLPSLQRLHMSHYYFGTRGSYVIDVPSLRYLKITYIGTCNFRQIENMPELVRAHVKFVGATTHKFLKALASVRHLTLWLSLPEVVNPSGLIFNRLVHLDLYTFTEGWWDLLSCMLQDSPKLRFLKLIDKLDRNIDCSREDIATGWKPWSSVPECLLHSLEAFEWFGYKGRREDKEIARYVLKNATCLKTATFSPRSTDLGEKYRMHKELASVATASASCLILFD